MDSRWRERKIGWVSVVSVVIGLWGLAGCSQSKQEDDYLIKVGETRIMVAEYERTFELASEEAFSGEAEIDAHQLGELHARVLNQLTEELIIAQRAKALGLSVSEAELEQAVAAIKADYPDDTFESTLLENAVSFAEWKRRLSTRLLIEKVIQKELVDTVQITAGDVEAYYKEHFTNEAPEETEDLRRRIVAHLRRQKAEENYKGWMENLRQTYPPEINQKRWNKMIQKADLPEEAKVRRDTETESSCN